ncbi:MAG: tRNA pseudouridine(38-40) synthase TruA [Candidatus Marinimicrobia bacterium]|nr:tRNA pseudouridine(38-40) synthase TruA [Candidatus Neomarinimicrobiota bacterium]
MKLLLEYDGTNYSGWQKQKNGITVQGELEKSLKIIVGQDLTVTGAGRTDKGVHAKGQVANFKTSADIPADKIKSGLNGTLPRDIRVLASEDVDDKFDSRRSAIERHYGYKIIRRVTALERHFAHRLEIELNVSEMNSAANFIMTQKDFNSFCKATSGTENGNCNVLKSVWNEYDDFLYYTIRADRFLHHMVRSLVGTMIEIGNGNIGIEDFKLIFEKSDRRAAGPTAPAHGLYLEKVIYPNDVN